MSRRKEGKKREHAYDNNKCRSGHDSGRTGERNLLDDGMCRKRAYGKMCR